MVKTNNLVWIDTEDTGLMDGTSHQSFEPHIIEISLLITDQDLNHLNQGLDLVVHQPQTILDSAQDWVKQNCADLLIESAKSLILEKQAEETLLSEIQRYCDPKTGILSGNSLWMDKVVINRYLPQIIDYLHYRVIDVSTIKELKKKWRPDLPEFEKKKTHRALDDIKESIEELRYYQQHFFRL